MKSFPAIVIFSLIAGSFSNAQNVTEEPLADPVLEAIQKFQKRDKSKPNEVTVILDDAAPDSARVQAIPPAVDETAGSPMSVTGKPPEGANVSTAVEKEFVDASAVDPSEDAPKSEDGLAVRVEKLQSGTGGIDPAKVKLLAPFPAKPLGQAPAGWHLEFSKSSPPFIREVEISPGKKIGLTIYPHLLVPDADGVSSFCIAEPGFNSSRGYQQTATVGAILATSIRQLDDDSKQLGNAIDSLQQLLVSLPKPEIQPEAKPTTARKR